MNQEELRAILMQIASVTAEERTHLVDEIIKEFANKDAGISTNQRLAEIVVLVVLLITNLLSLFLIYKM